MSKAFHAVLFVLKSGEYGRCLVANATIKSYQDCAKVWWFHNSVLVLVMLVSSWVAAQVAILADSWLLECGRSGYKRLRLVLLLDVVVGKW